MGKKIFFIIVCFFVVTTHVSFAYTQEISPSVTVSPTPVPSQYSLPYPGILPGHPLYFLKTVRDNLWGFFISNPLKKAEYNLLQADKLFAASESLFDQKKDNMLVLATLMKARKYFANALTKAKEANIQGIETDDFGKKLVLANKKHQEIVVGMQKRAKEDAKKLLSSELEKLKKLEKETQKQDRK